MIDCFKLLIITASIKRTKFKKKKKIVGKFVPKNDTFTFNPGKAF